MKKTFRIVCLSIPLIYSYFETKFMNDSNENGISNDFLFFFFRIPFPYTLILAKVYQWSGQISKIISLTLLYLQKLFFSWCRHFSNNKRKFWFQCVKNFYSAKTRNDGNDATKYIFDVGKIFLSKYYVHFARNVKNFCGTKIYLEIERNTLLCI